MVEVTEKMVKLAADVLMGHVNAPEQAIYKAARLALEAALASPAEVVETPPPESHLRLDVNRLAASIVTAACELDGPADPDGDDTISITTKDLEAVVHRHVTAALERQL